jgi:hypothetical protein
MSTGKAPRAVVTRRVLLAAGGLTVLAAYLDKPTMHVAGAAHPGAAPHSTATSPRPGRASGYTRPGTGCSAVWLARRVWVAEVAGSNPASPTSPTSRSRRTGAM